jgi:peptidoglycan/LPS O-acetylase OafA/YrhL
MLFGFALLIIHFDKPRWYFWVMVKIFGPHLLASLVYLHGQIYADASWIAGISWTLEIEVQFYLLLPLIAWIFKLSQRWLRRGILLSAVIASALVAQLVLPSLHNQRLNLSLLDLLHFFLAGMLLADFYLDPPRFELGRHAADAMVAACAAMLVYVVHYNLALTWLEPLLIALGFFAIFRGAWASRIFRWSPLTAVGAMSYTVYLYHLYVVELLMPFSSRWLGMGHALWLDAAIEFCVLLAPVLLVSAGLYLVAERPFVELSHTVTRRLRARQAAAEVQV